MEERRCMGCMGITGQAVCHICGYPHNGENEPHQLRAGYTLHRQYTIGRVLGQGGFGITYLGWDNFLDIPVAIKEFYPNSMVSRDISVTEKVRCYTDQVTHQYVMSKERFLREAKALARFEDEPAIVKIRGFFEENDTAYIIMEYVRGTTLASYVKMRGGKLSAGETLRILKPVIEALAAVHEAGLVHRDISPDNVMLHPRGGAKLLDFGAVRAVENAEAGKNMLRSTQTILKHGFAPMEQYQSRGGLGPWTDEYALCATIYYCITGKIPEEAPRRMLEEIEINWDLPGLNERQRCALRKGFSLRSRDRHGSVRKLMEQLYEYEENPIQPLQPAPVPQSRPEKIFRPKPETASHPKTETVSRPKPETVPRPKPETVPRPKPETVPRPKPETVPRPKPETVPRPKPETVPRQKPEMASQPRPENRPAEKRSGRFLALKWMIGAVAVAVMAIALILALPKGWKAESDGYTYYSMGRKLRDSWYQEENRFYYFDADGRMVTSWQVLNGQKYLFGSDGVMVRGWVNQNDCRYYLGEDGIMVTGLRQIDDAIYLFDGDGVSLTGWQEVDGKRCYFDKNGAMVIGWMENGSYIYYFDADGTVHTGWLTLDGKKYYMAQNGRAYVGLQNISGEYYYFNSDGSAATGWKHIEGDTYYFGSDGIMKTGLERIGGKTYYFDASGIMCKYWVDVFGRRYYFGPDGAALTGWQELYGKRYYFDRSGMMAIGWKNIHGDTYYFMADGELATGGHSIDGQWYNFDDEGRLC